MTLYHPSSDSDKFRIKCKSCLKEIFVKKSDVKITDDKNIDGLLFIKIKPICNCYKTCRLHKLSYYYNQNYNPHYSKYYVSCDNCENNKVFNKKDIVFIIKHGSPEEKLNKLKSINQNINITKRILITTTILLMIATATTAILNIVYFSIIALIQTLVMFYTVYRESKKNKNIAKKIRVAEQEYNESMLPVWEKIIEESERELNEISCSRTG
jgi:hypothetical protein